MIDAIADLFAKITSCHALQTVSIQVHMKTVSLLVELFTLLTHPAVFYSSIWKQQQLTVYPQPDINYLCVTEERAHSCAYTTQ